jgi:RNA polymerase sigma factor (sigma-70 family)
MVKKSRQQDNTAWMVREHQSEPTDGALVESIRAGLKEASQALQQGEDERALRWLQQAVEQKRELWQRLRPQVQQLSRRFARYTERKAGLTEDDLQSEAFLKFSRVVCRWDSRRGASFRGWLALVLARYFCDLGRKRCLEQLPDNVEETALDRKPGLAAGTPRTDIEDVVGSLLVGDPRRELKIGVFKRYWFEQWTLAELAEQLTVSVGCIHRWLTEVKEAFADSFSAEQ